MKFQLFVALAMVAITAAKTTYKGTTTDTRVR